MDPGTSFPSRSRSRGALWRTLRSEWPAPVPAVLPRSPCLMEKHSRPATPSRKPVRRATSGKIDLDGIEANHHVRFRATSLTSLRLAPADLPIVVEIAQLRGMTSWPNRYGVLSRSSPRDAPEVSASIMVHIELLASSQTIDYGPRRSPPRRNPGRRISFHVRSGSCTRAAVRSFLMMPSLEVATDEYPCGAANPPIDRRHRL